MRPDDQGIRWLRRAWRPLALALVLIGAVSLVHPGRGQAAEDSGPVSRKSPTRTELIGSASARDRTGCAIVIVAHDVPLLLSIADRLVAMDLGRVIADGPPAEVVRHPAVVSSYLGSGADPAIVSVGGHPRTPGRP